jgi:hypothetical protein
MSAPPLVIPQIKTCSYTGYRRDFGTAIRITLGIPRFIHLPDPRYSAYSRWPYIEELAPRREYFSAPEAEFDARYLDQLSRSAADIFRKLSWFAAEGMAEHGSIVLLCFEKRINGPHDCHRRLAANWLSERLGIEIPEMDPGPGGCK